MAQPGIVYCEGTSKGETPREVDTSAWFLHQSDTWHSELISKGLASLAREKITEVCGLGVRVPSRFLGVGGDDWESQIICN